LIGINASSHLMTVTTDIHPELWEYDIEGNKPTPQKHRLAFPGPCAILEVEGSPDGRRVAYLVQESQSSFLTGLLERFHSHSYDATNNLSLWVSRADGTELHRLGYERVSEAGGLHWSPDSKNLGIFLDDGFYIVPAD